MPTPTSVNILGKCGTCCPSCAIYAGLANLIVTVSGITLCSGATGTVNGTFTLSSSGGGFGQFRNTVGSVVIGGVTYPTYMWFRCGFAGSKFVELEYFAYSGSPFSNFGSIFQNFGTTLPVHGAILPSNQSSSAGCGAGTGGWIGWGGTATLSP